MRMSTGQCGLAWVTGRGSGSTICSRSDARKTRVSRWSLCVCRSMLCGVGSVGSVSRPGVASQSDDVVTTRRRQHASRRVASRLIDVRPALHCTARPVCRSDRRSLNSRRPAHVTSLPRSPVTSAFCDVTSRSTGLLIAPFHAAMLVM